MNNTLRDELLHHLDEGSTGCLSVTARGGQLRVYVMSGEILASDSPEDNVQLLRRVVVSGLVDRGRASELMREATDQGLPVSEILYGVLDEDQVVGLLFDRFRENVANWLCSETSSEFEPMDAIFVPNIQIGHDSRELLGQIEVTLARTAPLRSDDGFRTQLAVGPVPPQTDDDRVLVEVVQRARSVAPILRGSPFEELYTLDRLMRMLDSAVLLKHDPDQDRTFVEDDDSDEAETVANDPTEVVEVPEAGESEADDEDGLQLTVGLTGHENLSPEELAALEHEMSLFEDIDHDVGRGGGEGHFSKSRDELNADRIDLSERVEMPEEIAAGPAEATAQVPNGPSVSVKYSGPMLSNSDARRKIEVANGVLRVLSQSFDASNGKGSGPSQVQLLLDGSPTEFAVLFQKVQAAEDGSASPEGLLANLRRRPAAEHRRLLNRALSDIIERAMNVAAENLDDDALDALLEGCAGYQQRLGL
ncbi:MAG: hypothetical protein H6739_18785 [Alphaproteobacteria bacterium]|nr:hypothetical protein [Alphaproteobacteria bacterium]